MITRIRTWTALPGKGFELVAVLKEISATAARISGLPQSAVPVSVGGDLGEASLIISAESVDQSDENIAKIIAHPEFAPLIGKLTPLVEGGGFEQIYRHV